MMVAMPRIAFICKRLKGQTTITKAIGAEMIGCDALSLLVRAVLLQDGAARDLLLPRPLDSPDTSIADTTNAVKEKLALVSTAMS